MSPATEVLLNTAETAITNTAKITVVSFSPREDDLLIINLIKIFLLLEKALQYLFKLLFLS